MSAVLSAAVRPTTYRAHPGKASVPRQVGARAAVVRNFWADLSDKPELFEACKSAAMGFPQQSVLFRITGIELSRAALHVIEDGQDEKMIRYASPIVFDEPSTLLSAHMTIAWQDGLPVPHAHGYLVSSTGKVVGGHLSPDRCFFAWRDQPIEVQMNVLTGCQLVPRHDEETGFSLFTPVEQGVS